MSANGRVRSSHVLIEYGPHNPEHGNACYDCRKRLPARTALVCRGVNDEGQFSLFVLCPRCANLEALFIETGYTRRQRIVRRLLFLPIRKR